MFHGDRLILIGKVTATHGINGLLRVVPYSGEADSILALKTIQIRCPDGAMHSFKVTASSVHGKKVLIRLSTYTEINQVLPLVGGEIYIRRDDLPELSEDEFYWCDLIGMKVITDQGDHLGELVDIVVTGSNDVYVVRAGLREYMIPAIEDVVKKVDLDSGVITVSPSEGMLEL